MEKGREEERKGGRKEGRKEGREEDRKGGRKEENINAHVSFINTLNQ